MKKKIKELEKRVAELEGQVQEQPDVEKISESLESRMVNLSNKQCVSNKNKVVNEVADQIEKKAVRMMQLNHLAPTDMCNALEQAKKRFSYADIKSSKSEKKEAELEVRVQEQPKKLDLPPLTELEINCIAQHYKYWYYSMIGNYQLDCTSAFVKACEECAERCKCSDMYEHPHNAFTSSIIKLSEISDVEISIIKK